MIVFGDELAELLTKKRKYFSKPSDILEIYYIYVIKFIENR